MTSVSSAMSFCFALITWQQMGALE